MLKDALLAAALTFRPWYGEVEAPTERLERLTTLTEAIALATADATCARSSEVDGPRPDCRPLWFGEERTLAFLLLAQAYFETKLARHVHEGKCRTAQGECDSGRAISLWQLHAGPQLPKEEWSQLAGSELEPTRRAALEAARALGRGANYCRSLEGAISLYATGKSCSWGPSQSRAGFVRDLLERYPLPASPDRLH